MGWRQLLYLGHFGFVKEEATAAEGWHGYFTCVVEAEDIDSALDRFNALIRGLRETDDVLDDIDRVSLDDCTEIKAIPEGGFLAHFREWDSVPVGCISTSIRGASDEEVAAYGPGPGEPADDDGDFTEEPFIEF